MGITMNFTLVDQRLLAFMNEFYGIFNGQDMLILGGVDLIDHRCHGRTFTGTCRSGYRNQATGIVGDILKHIAHAKLFHAEYLGRNSSENGGCAAILDKGVDPETGQTGNFK